MSVLKAECDSIPTQSFLMTIRTSLFLFLSSAISFCAGSLLQGQVLPDAVTLNWDASLDDDGDNAWSSNEDPPSAWTFGGNTATVKGTSNLPRINAWFAAPKATMLSFHDVLGDAATREDVSWEKIK